MEIRCENPVYIWNPHLLDLMRCGFRTMLIGNREINVSDADFAAYSLDGHFSSRKFRIIDKYHLRPMFYSLIPEKFHTVECRTDKLISQLSIYGRSFSELYTKTYIYSYEDLDNAVLVNASTGECVELFQITGCGHCLCCLENKNQEFVNRNLLEEVMSDAPIYFATLTFNAENYPNIFKQKDLKEHTKYLQKFFKRLRKRLAKDKFSTDFRYYAVSEYGSERGRLHFHIIFYNVDKKVTFLNGDNYKVYSDNPFKGINGDFRTSVPRFEQYVALSWSYYNKSLGFVYVEEVDETQEQSSKGVSKYLSKYITKSLLQPTKHLHSKGFGKEYLLENKASLRESIRLLNEKFNVANTSKELPFYRYVFSKVCPSSKEVFSKDFRDKLEQFDEALNKFYRFTFYYENNVMDDIAEDLYVKYYNKFYKKFSKLIRTFYNYDYSTKLDPPLLLFNSKTSYYFSFSKEMKKFRHVWFKEKSKHKCFKNTDKFLDTVVDDDKIRKAYFDHAATLERNYDVFHEHNKVYKNSTNLVKQSKDFQ